MPYRPHHIARLLTISILTWTLSFAALSTTKDTLSYEDLFHLEFSANPIILNDQKTVLYERHSMNIMADNKRINLWTVQLD